MHRCGKRLTVSCRNRLRLTSCKRKEKRPKNAWTTTVKRRSAAHRWFDVYSIHCRVRSSIRAPISPAPRTTTTRDVRSATDGRHSEEWVPVVFLAVPPSPRWRPLQARRRRRFRALDWCRKVVVSPEHVRTVSLIAFRNQLFHIWSRRPERPFA